MASAIQIGDIVWAKMPTYPQWPAIVVTPEKNITAPYMGNETQHFVKFYGPGTKNCSWIPDKNIVPHSHEIMRKALKNKKSKKLQIAIVELEKHLKREGLIEEKQEEEADTKKRYKKRKRNQEAIKAKNKRAKVSGNKEINDTDVVIEDHNLHKNQKEDVDLLVSCNQIKERGSAFDGLQIQNKDEHNNVNKIQDKVNLHPIVLPNTEDIMEIENQHVQQLEIEKVVSIKDCEKKENTEPLKKNQDATSSENEFHGNEIISIPITPNDDDKLQLKSSQNCLNIFSDVLPSLIEPFRKNNESNEKKCLFKKYLPDPISPIKFGFMGDGKLKSSILKNLIKNKLNVTLWIDTNKKTNNEEYYASSAKTVNTFKDLFEQSDIIFSYWENSKTAKYQMLKVLTSVSTEIFAKKGYVELSTLDPDTAYCCVRAISNHGGRFLEAAVLGDRQAADNGDLLLLASGDETVFDDCSSSFSAISSFSYYCTGKIGSGSLMKVGLSMVLGTALAGLAEVVNLIRNYGFKEDEFTDVLQSTPFQHKFWMEKAKSMFKGNRVTFQPVVDQRKDFVLGQKLAGHLKLPRSTCSSAKDFFDDNDIDPEMNFYRV